jgi:type I restriction enzyme R subunit
MKTHLILISRYKELYSGSSGGGAVSEVPYEIEGHLTEIDTR